MRLYASRTSTMLISVEGIVAIDITPPFSAQPLTESENVLLVTHGLTGGSHESYIRSVLTSVARSKESGGLGFRAVVLNFRGCNGSPVVTPRLYHVSHFYQFARVHFLIIAR